MIKFKKCAGRGWPIPDKRHGARVLGGCIFLLLILGPLIPALGKENEINIQNKMQIFGCPENFLSEKDKRAIADVFPIPEPETRLSDPSKRKPFFLPKEPISLTLSGLKGLVSIPVPAISRETSTTAFFRRGFSPSNSSINGRNFRFKKAENFSGISARLRNNLEFSLVHLSFKRTAFPFLVPNDEGGKCFSLGFKYSRPLSNFQSACLGWNFGIFPSHISEIIDLSQVENLKSVFATWEFKFSGKCSGYIGIKGCTSSSQAFKIMETKWARVERKPFLTEGVGWIFSPNPGISMVLEGKFINHWDLFQGNIRRFSVNGGLNLRFHDFQLEFKSLNWSQIPGYFWGGTFAFE